MLWAFHKVMLWIIKIELFYNSVLYIWIYKYTKSNPKVKLMHNWNKFWILSQFLMIKALPRVLGMTITLYVWFGMSFEFQYRKSLCMYWLTSLKQVKKNRFIFMIPCVFMCKKENCLRKYFIITIEIFFFLIEFLL